MGNTLFQVVVPAKFSRLVLQVSHYQSGHHGVRKTNGNIPHYFFWPWLKRMCQSTLCLATHVRYLANQTRLLSLPQPNTCHWCEPFEHIIVDSVGPLTPSRSGPKYLLTFMCQATRYPAAHPLWSITTRSVLRNLFTSFWHPQGSSYLSAQVLEQLQMKHRQSSAYCAQSQGMLEHFHQTLKSLLHAWKACHGFTASREVNQESTGCSPNDLGLFMVHWQC